LHHQATAQAVAFLFAVAFFRRAFFHSPARKRSLLLSFRSEAEESASLPQIQVISTEGEAEVERSRYFAVA
jgi:hypothetical protein